MRKAYPVIFTQTDSVILVEVPDLEILTEGKNIENAIMMARDAIGIHGITRENHQQFFPNPSNIQDINPSMGTFSHEGTSFVSIVDVDFAEYRRKLDNKSVRRNVTLPNWLNREAEQAHINVSKVLQEALMVKLNVWR